MATYDAFISYSHAKDKAIAAALQSEIQRLGKTWYKRRLLRVFRDDTSLSATPHLWPSIIQSLDQSRFLILLASPEAASSAWVGKELMHWLDHNNADTLLIALTAGHLEWDDSAGDFMWSDATPLPSVLIGRFFAEPKWVDLRTYRESIPKGDSKFLERAADFAAAIHGIPKEDLLSQEMRQQRRALALAWFAATSLLVIASLAGWFGFQSQLQRERAEKQTQIANEQRDAAEMANGMASDERDRANVALSAALGTAEDIIAKVATDLSEIPGIKPEVVHTLIDEALKLQDDLAGAKLTSLELVEGRAITLNAAANTLMKIGDRKSALAEAVKSNSIWRDLNWKKADVQDLMSGLASNLQLIGDIKLQEGDVLGAQASYEEGISVVRKFATGEGSDKAQIEARRQLAYLLIRLHKVKNRLNDKIVAYSTLLEGMIILCKQAKDPSNAEAQGDLAAALQYLGAPPSAASQCIEMVRDMK